MENKKSPEQQEMAYKYLLAHVQYTSWIPDEYKELAKRNTSPDILRELYLCALDRVPIEGIQKALQQKNPAALGTLRCQYWEESVTKEYKQELEELRQRIKAAEETIALQEHQIKNVPKFGTPDVPAEKEESNTKPKDKEPVAFVKRWKPFWKKEISPKTFLEEIINEYNTKQLAFIMDCIEEGIPAPVIRSFISPALPVEVMERLKKMQCKTEKKVSIKEKIAMYRNSVHMEEEDN